MSKTVFGEINWNDGDVFEGGGGGSKKSDFMKLEQGKSRVRVMGNPVQYYVHWVDLPDGKKRKYNSPVGDPKLVKQLTDAGFKRQARWIVKVLDRADNQFKLLEIGSQVFSGIKALYSDSDWGPVTAYDLTIDRGAPGQQPLYRVTPRPKSPLEDSVKQAYRDFEQRVDVSKMTQPEDPEKIRDELGWDAPVAKMTVSADDDSFYSFADDE